jgi:hypothetical protein
MQTPQKWRALVAEPTVRPVCQAACDELDPADDDLRFYAELAASAGVFLIGRL